jgi:hypothetical protein
VLKKVKGNSAPRRFTLLRGLSNYHLRAIVPRGPLGQATNLQTSVVIPGQRWLRRIVRHGEACSGWSSDAAKASVIRCPI